MLDALIDNNDWPIKDRAVLDVGCGTGYFIDYWTRRQASPIMGVDLAEVSIDNLKSRYPDARFACADLSDPELKLHGSYDYISIFDVLYHIVDDGKFALAAGNLAKVCRPGSKVFVTDLFGSRTVSLVKHCRNRSLGLYEKIFSEHGFKLIDIKPLFYMLMPPTAVANGFLRWLGVLAWEAVTFAGRWELPGRLLGRLLYGFDAALRKVFRRSPSGQLAVFEFVGTSAG